MDNTIYVYYTPGCVEKLRILDRRSRAAGKSVRILTARTLFGSKTARKYKNPRWMLALHAVGGGTYHDFASNVTEKFSKTRLERHFTRHAHNAARTTAR
jgi:hypothetical protein